MTPHSKDRLRTAYTISVDARDGVSTGISAADRAHTARTLADSATEPGDLTRPGHVFPLRYREGVTGAMRLTSGLRRFAIRAASDPDGSKRDLVCLVEEVRA